MRLSIRFVCIVALLVLPSAFAQKWEFGGGAGAGFYTSTDVKGSAATAGAKLATGLAASAWLANNKGNVWGGELRYDFQQGDMKLSSGGTSAAFAAQTHAIHYDFQLHFAPQEASVRPFVAFGGGAKVYRGTGAEVAYQPLNQIALLTKTTDVRPLASVGVGLKINEGRRLGFRLEFHDFLTPFPDKIIAPAQNSKVSGWIHDFVATAGVSLLL